jgi:hypothetical protein
MRGKAYNTVNVRLHYPFCCHTIVSAVFLARKKILGIYTLSPEATDYAANIWRSWHLSLGKTPSYTLIIGVLRAGVMCDIA